MLSFLAANLIREKVSDSFSVVVTFFGQKLIQYIPNSLFFLSPLGPREALSQS
jgi:hypothetical protein